MRVTFERFNGNVKWCNCLSIIVGGWDGVPCFQLGWIACDGVVQSGFWDGLIFIIQASKFGG